MTTDKLNEILGIKAAFKSALIENGADGVTDVFADYPELIRSLKGAGGGNTVYDTFFEKVPGEFVEKREKTDGQWYVVRYAKYKYVYADGIYVPGEEVSREEVTMLSFEVDLNGQWRLSETVPNPDPELYDGVYESFSNWHVGGEIAEMYVTVFGLSRFRIYVRDYAENGWDYVRVYRPDGSMLYGNNGKSNGGTDIGSYTEVIIDNPGSGEFTFKIDYRKDGGGDQNDDRGYLLIPYDQNFD